LQPGAVEDSLNYVNNRCDENRSNSPTDCEPGVRNKDPVEKRRATKRSLKEIEEEEEPPKKQGHKPKETPKVASPAVVIPPKANAR
jgi:hypothetical protein